MSSIQAEIAVIGQRLIDEFRGAIAGTVKLSQLQHTVWDLTVLMRNAGSTPEGVIVHVKGAAFDAGAGPAEHGVVSLERRSTQALAGNLVAWTIAAYFQDAHSAGGAQRQPDRSQENP